MFKGNLQGSIMACKFVTVKGLGVPRLVTRCQITKHVPELENPKHCHLNGIIVTFERVTRDALFHVSTGEVSLGFC